MKALLALATGVVMTTAAVIVHQPAQAQIGRSCVPLREVTTGQRSIRKVIALNSSNANTDFAVPTGRRFTSYVAQVIPENNSTYRVDVNLKYNDGTSAQALTREFNARRFFRYDQVLQSPTGRQPYQINTFIAGDRNTAYRVNVYACQ